MRLTRKTEVCLKVQKHNFIGRYCIKRKIPLNNWFPDVSIIRKKSIYQSQVNILAKVNNSV